MTTNRKLAKLFREMALMLELEEVKWKPRAYRTAARGIEQESDDVSGIYEEHGKKGLKQIAGVGDSIADHIIEYLDSGKIPKFEKLRKKYPESVTELVALEGLGPKTVQRLVKELDISSISDLRKAVKEHRIRDLEGFGTKTESNILDAIKMHAKRRDRMLQNTALAIAEEMIEYLKENATLEKIQYVGSLRRMKETIGDIDILVVSKKPKEVMEAFTDFPDVKDVVSKGSTRSTIVLEEQDVHVDLRGVKTSSYAAALQYFTGSKEHTVELRKQAIKQGYKLSEYGLFKKSSDKRISLSSEKALYEKLGYSYIPPELRENNGELEKAKKGKLPRLVALDDVKGDLQMHTTYSDGADEIEDMAKAAQQLGYEYIAITDHSKSERVASGLDEKQLKKQWEELDKVADKLKIKVLRGSEVDIRKDGSLDYSDEILKELHIVVAAVHSGFKMSEKEMTERIIKALNNEYVDILSHPTGRMIGKREGYQADFDTIFEVAAENGKVVEINADPERLDLNDVMIRAAKDKGVKFSIGTDSHATSSLENMKFGVGQARRGWLTKNDVVNTFSYKRLKKVFTRLP